MKPSESVEGFATHFLHLCHEIPEPFMDLDFITQELKHFVHVSWNGEIPDFSSSSTLVDNETPHVSKKVPLAATTKLRNLHSGYPLTVVAKMRNLNGMFPTHLLGCLPPQWRKL